jgi:lipopolysaccharide transport system ATP-binding protein
MRTAIQVEGLSKRYRISSGESAYGLLRDDIMAAIVRPFKRMTGHSEAATREFWALRDVTFDVKVGEFVGIVGANGAGKTTLLRLLSRITPPTSGSARLYGQVASLLEVGTGFHPELTGRENIFLNGAILGMKRNDIRARLDEIIDFADIGPFLDTPMKRYSTGMYVRLAFAVAAHLEPEILLADEVLAVGDPYFHEKCTRKMREVSREGRTILFVSHEMAAVKAMCSRALRVHAGKVVADGDPQAVISEYLKGLGDPSAGAKTWPTDQAPGDERCRIHAMRVVGAGNHVGGSYPSSSEIGVEIDFNVEVPHRALCVGFDLLAPDGSILLRSYHTDQHPLQWPEVRVGENRIRATIPAGLLNEGTYSIAPKVVLQDYEDWVVNGDPVLSFHVRLEHSDSPFWNAVYSSKFPGLIAPCLPWKAESPEGR